MRAIRPAPPLQSQTRSNGSTFGTMARMNWRRVENERRTNRKSNNPPAKPHKVTTLGTTRRRRPPGRTRPDYFDVVASSSPERKVTEEEYRHALMRAPIVLRIEGWSERKPGQWGEPVAWWWPFKGDYDLVSAIRIFEPAMAEKIEIGRRCYGE